MSQADESVTMNDQSLLLNELEDGLAAEQVQMLFAKGDKNAPRGSILQTNQNDLSFYSDNLGEEAPNESF